MEVQFDNEPLDFIDPHKEYACSPLCNAIGFTLLMKWCLMNHREPNITDKIRTYLKEHPESINEKNNKGWTPLILSARNARTFSSEAIVSLLIESGADLNAQDWRGWTPLMTACKNSATDSSYNTIHLLIKAGADLNIKADDGTVLHIIRDTYIDNADEVLKIFKDILP